MLPHVPTRRAGWLMTMLALALPVPCHAEVPVQTGIGESESYQAHITYLGSDDGWSPLPFERYSGVIFFQASINGAAATVLLDNGFSHSVLDAGFAQRIGAQVHDTGKTSRTGTATAPMRLAEGITIDIPHQLRLTTTTGVMDFAPLVREIHHPVDAVLGGDLLGHLAVGIFPGKRVLMFLPSGKITPSPGVHSREIPLVDGDRIQAEINGQPARLQVDLGSNAMVMLSDTAWARIFPDDSQAMKGSSVRAEGVPLETRRMPGAALAFSGFEAKGVVVETSGPLPGEQDGLLGEGILSHADIVLDIPAAKLILMRDAPSAGPAASHVPDPTAPRPRPSPTPGAGPAPSGTASMR